MKFGSQNDDLVDFADAFHVQPALNDLFFVDFIFNQEDRHSKNIGLIGKSLSPIFDSGACLHYHVLDTALSAYASAMPKHKTFGKPLDQLLEFSLKYLCPHFSFKFDEVHVQEVLDKILGSMADKYSEQRLIFVHKLVKERIANVGRILAKA